MNSELAKAALILLNRVDLKGSEAEAYVAVTGALRGFVEEEAEEVTSESESIQ